MLALLPGIIIATALALFSMWLNTLHIWPFMINGVHYFDEIVIAIFLGIFLNTFLNLPQWLRAGTKFASQYALLLGIMFVGSQINIYQILALSGNVIIIIISCIVFTILFTLWLSRNIRINHRLGILLAVSTAICGGSAVIATAPVVRAYQAHVAIAFTLTHLFSTISVLLLPALGLLLAVPENAFGIWAGTSIHAVGQAIATGFSYSDEAGNIATLVKLARVLMLAPVIFIIALFYGHYYKRLGVQNTTSSVGWQNYIPPFLIGFIIMVIINSMGLLPIIEVKQYTINTTLILDRASFFLILVALASMGLNTRFKNLFKLGYKPFIIATTAFIGLLLFSAILIYFLI